MSEFDEVEWRRELVLSPDNLHQITNIKFNVQRLVATCFKVDP